MPGPPADLHASRLRLSIRRSHASFASCTSCTASVAKRSEHGTPRVVHPGVVSMRDRTTIFQWIPPAFACCRAHPGTSIAEDRRARQSWLPRAQRRASSGWIQLGFGISPRLSEELRKCGSLAIAMRCHTAYGLAPKLLHGDSEAVDEADLASAPPRSGVAPSWVRKIGPRS